MALPENRGKFEHAALVHHLAERGVGGGEEGRGAGDFDLLGDVADFHLHIHFDVVVDADLHVLAHEFLEAGSLGGDIVEAGEQEWQGIVAGLVGLSGYRHTSGDVGGLDFGGWHYGAAGIGDAAQNRTTRFLGVNGNGEQERQQGRAEKYLASHRTSPITRF